MNRYLVIFILAFFAQSTWANDDDDDVQRLLNYSIRATNFTRSYPPHEKVYLHMDNRSYFLDETLWYKAYVVDADSNRLTKASEILHIELLSPEGAVIRTQKQRLVDGQCDGYFTLDSALYSGYFEIRAYTKVMLNYDEQNYFSRVFPLFEKPKRLGEFDSIRRTLPRYRTVGAIKSEKDNEKEKEQTKKAPNYRVNFYPEGGSLVKNLKSNIAFQIKDSYGEIVNTKCYLWSPQNIILDSVFSSHLGMGLFQITPERKSNGYYITIKGDYKNSKFPLPEALKRGYTLSADNLSDSVNLKIRIESTEFNNHLGIAILSRGCTGFSDAIMITKENPILLIEIDKSSLREGVNQVVIYDILGRELASRMVFINNNNKDNTLTIEATTQPESKIVKTYEKQGVQFKVKNTKGQGVETTFSLSIYDSTSHSPTFYRGNIYTNLLLSSEVKGFIPNVDYYFESKDVDRERNLDLLLQVYGWSRYKWEYLNGSKKMENNYFLEKNLLIYGKSYGQTWLPDSLIFYPTDKIIRLLGTRGISLVHVYDDSLLYYKNNEKSTSLFWNKDKFPSHPCPINNYAQFYMNIGDFYGETKFLLSSRDSRINRIKAKYGHMYPFFIMDSEYSPEEKEYDYFEITSPKRESSSYAIINGEYINQYSIDKIDIHKVQNRVFHPAIKTKYYNQGFYSDLYPAFNRPILDRVLNKGLTSLSEYNKSYDVDSYKKYTTPKTRSKDTNEDPDKRDELWSRSRHIEFPTEYLQYHKLPLGRITFISNTTVDTTNTHENRSYFTTPLEHETLDIEDFDLDPSKYTCFIDSTVIHTDYNTITNFHNKFKSHSEYQQYEIKNSDKSPTKTSEKLQPNYVVEHFCRIIKQKAKRYNVFKLRYMDFAFQGHEMKDIKSRRERIRENHTSDRDQTKRAIIFQGLTRMGKEFYSPNYSNTPLPTQGDYRRTLYWNPNVKTDSNGEASVEFYNNSSCTKYHIDAQTVTKNGEIGVLFR